MRRFGGRCWYADVDLCGLVIGLIREMDGAVFVGPRIDFSVGKGGEAGNK